MYGVERGYFFPANVISNAEMWKAFQWSYGMRMDCEGNSEAGS